MLALGKLALGFTGTIVLAGAYTFREGVIRVDVDENRDGGSHVHFWVPAAAVPMALHLVPRDKLQEGAAQVHEQMPIIRAFTRELAKYPHVTFVEVRDGEQRVKISTEGHRLRIDVDAPEEKVHLAVPVETMSDIFEQLDASTHGSTPL